MPIGIRCQFSLRKFQDGLGFVFQVKSLFNFPKYTDAIIVDENASGRTLLLYLDTKFRSTRMIEHVVDHLGDAVMPNVNTVFGQPFDQREHGHVPDLILIKSGLYEEKELSLIAI